MARRNENADDAGEDPEELEIELQKPPITKLIDGIVEFMEYVDDFAEESSDNQPMAS